MRKSKLIVGVIAVAVIVVAVGVVYFRAASPKDNQTVIGAILPLTGSTAFIGEDMKNGVLLAQKSLPNSQVVFEDSQGDAKTMVTAYHNLRAKSDPDVIIAASTGVEALIPLAEADQVPLMLTVSSASGLPQKGEYIFRYFTNADNDAPVMAQYATQELGRKKFAVLYLMDQFGLDYLRVFTDEVKKYGGDVVASESFQYTDYDLKTQLTKIKEKDFDALYVVGLDYQILTALKQAKELGINQQIIALGQVATKDAITKAGATIEGVYVTAFCTDGAPPKYVGDFQAAYNAYPGFFSEIGYDIVEMIKSAAAKGQTKEAIKKGLLGVKNFAGNTGTISSDAFGEMVIPMCVKKITDGKIYNLATGKYSEY